MTAITALTAQSTVGVTGIHPVPGEFIVEQVKTVAEDIGVDAVKIAVEKARAHGHSLEGAVLASDAFFPFADGPELALAAGIGAIIQPGGSKRDDEVVAAVRETGAAMVLTGRRHFRH